MFLENGVYICFLSSFLVAITPVLGSCGLPPCCRLRRSDRKLNKEIAAMFERDVSFCCSCLEKNYSPFKLITVSDDEDAMDRLYGKIGWQLYRVKQSDSGNRLGVLCFRSLKRILNLITKKRIGCFIYRLEGFPRIDFKYTSNLKGIVDVPLEYAYASF